MDIQQIHDGLNALGFNRGYAVGGDPAEIILWENDESQPSLKEIEAASVQGAYDREYAAVDEQRRQAYSREADPLFFKSQRGKSTKQEWLDKIDEIDARFPYPEPPKGKK